MTPGKSGGKGKGKAISKGYQFSHHIQSLCGSRRRRGLFTPKKKALLEDDGDRSRHLVLLLLQLIGGLN